MLPTLSGTGPEEVATRLAGAVISSWSGAGLLSLWQVQFLSSERGRGAVQLTLSGTGLAAVAARFASAVITARSGALALCLLLVHFRHSHGLCYNWFRTFRGMACFICTVLTITRLV